MVNIFGTPKGHTSLHTSSNKSKSKKEKENDKESKNENVQVNNKDNGQKEKGNDNDDDDDEVILQKEKDKLKEKTKTIKIKVEDNVYEPESVTQINTRLNALLYHTSNETVDLYKQENTSSDLLGRLYYDDYDSDSVSSTIISETGTPLLSPNVTGGAGIPTSEYFQSKLGVASASSPSVNSTLGTTRSSSATRRPGLNRIRSFERGISFDTSTDDHRKSLTFKVKHPNFKFRRNNKTFLAGFNDDYESSKAIEWLFDEMVINGDTIIILQVLDEKTYDKIDKLKANRTLNKIESLNTHARKVSLVFEVVIGKPQKLLKKAIDEYNPAMMIIGTHHYEYKDGSTHSPHHYKLLAKASMSKHFLQCALVPVIVVKPTYQYIENLTNPIESESYFRDWIANIDITGTYSKDKNKRKSRLNTLSPSMSRSNSGSNITASVTERGRSNDYFRQHENRGRTADAKADDKDNDEFKIRLMLSRSNSRSRSRSRSTSKSRGFVNLFSHH